MTLVMTLAIARAAAAADAADAPVIEGLLRFVDALEAGDAAALERSISAESSFQERSRKVFVDMAVAQKALERSARSRFGEEGRIFRCGFDLIVNGMDRRAIAGAKVLYDDPIRMARIEKPGELAAMPMRRNQDNQWQVVLDHIEQEDEDHWPPSPYPQPGFTGRQAQLVAIKSNKNNAILQAFKQTQARIESGELASAAAAQEELKAKLTAASFEAAKARAAIPSNRAPKDRP